MELEALLAVEVVEALENFLESKRPPEHIRPELDISYRIEGQSVYIFEIRPAWNNPSKILHSDNAKATFVKSKNEWKVFWMRASGNWENYPPQPTVKTIKKFVDLVDEDAHCCFWG